MRRREEVEQREREAAALAAQCALPRASEGHRIIYLGAYGGNAISTASLDGDDVEVSLIDVAVEPGSEPLYVIADSYYSAIWRLSGATDRVKNMVVTSDARARSKALPRIGVIGVKREAVHFARRADCFAAMRPASRPSRTRGWLFPDRTLVKLIGRDADHVHHSTIDLLWTSVSRFNLPNGKMSLDAADYAGRRSLPEKGASAEIWREILRLQPGGIVEVDPASVVAAVPVARYAVLPGAAGIADLIDKGVLEPIEWRDGFRDGRRVQIGGLRPDQIDQPGHFKAPIGFRVTKAMQFPGGRLSLFSVADPRFVVAPGVARPGGVPAYACLVDEATGTVISGGRSGRCR